MMSMSFNMRILVTGGAGFIGSHIVEHYHEKHKVRVIDDLRSGFRHNLDGFKCEFIEASILNRDAVRRAMEGADCVFHLAAMTNIAESMCKPNAYIEANAIGTLIVLEEAVRASVKQIVFSSSASVYGDNPTAAMEEHMTPKPNSPYAISKLTSECYCNMFAGLGRLRTICLRYFNVFGARQNAHGVTPPAVSSFIHRAIRNEPITVFGDGHQTRDFVFVRDVVSANDYFANQSSATGVFNVASGQSTTINELVTTVCSLTGSRSTVKYLAGRQGEVRHSLGSVVKLRAAGFKTTTNFRDTLKATIGAFKLTSSIGLA